MSTIVSCRACGHSLVVLAYACSASHAFLAGRQIVFLHCVHHARLTPPSKPALEVVGAWQGFAGSCLRRSPLFAHYKMTCTLPDDVSLVIYLDLLPIWILNQTFQTSLLLSNFGQHFGPSSAFLSDVKRPPLLSLTMTSPHGTQPTVAYSPIKFTISFVEQVT
ncbi:hypothetical protein BDQ17DRAFT_905837 [Cyathus striatus]|nr:hypothetical protein BDQ17DRAFT_905837 [Cyathus striatus]